MRNVVFVTMILLASYFVSSCVKDRCTDTVCLNKGICVDNKCACPAGYEGETCENGWQEKFEGDWAARDTWAGIKDTSDILRYEINITGNPDSFFIKGFHDTIGTSVICYRESPLGFKFKDEQVLDSFVTIRSGKGFLKEDGKVKGFYTISLPKLDTTITLNFTWTR